MLAFITFNEANYLKEKKLRGGGDHAHAVNLTSSKGTKFHLATMMVKLSKLD